MCDEMSVCAAGKARTDAINQSVMSHYLMSHKGSALVVWERDMTWDCRMDFFAKLVHMTLD